jgi:hypothetical protein
MLRGDLWWLPSRMAATCRASNGHCLHEEDRVDGQPAAPTDEAVSTTDMPVWQTRLPLLLLVVGINPLLTCIVFPGGPGLRARGLPQSQHRPRHRPVVADRGDGRVRLGHGADLKASVNEGMFGFMLRVLHTASEAGYGGVVASLAELPSSKRPCSSYRPTSR